MRVGCRDTGASRHAPSCEPHSASPAHAPTREAPPSLARGRRRGRRAPLLSTRALIWRSLRRFQQATPSRSAAALPRSHPPDRLSEARRQSTSRRSSASADSPGACPNASLTLSASARPALAGARSRPCCHWELRGSQWTPTTGGAGLRSPLRQAAQGAPRSLRPPRQRLSSAHPVNCGGVALPAEIPRLGSQSPRGPAAGPTLRCPNPWRTPLAPG